MREHGTRARYVHGPDEQDRPGSGCRCEECRAANRIAQAAYARRALHRRWGAEPPALVDAEPVRAHVRSLQAAGIGWKRIAAAAGVPQGSMCNLLFGYASRPPARRVTPRTAEKILAVRPEGLVADGAYVDAAGTRRRLQALVAVGYSLSSLGRRLGIAPTNMGELLKQTKVTAARARAVRELYERLWNASPAASTRTERASVTRARATARSRGWPPPGGWDDDLIDLPDAELAAELARRVAAMDDAETQASHTAHYKHGDISPLVVAAAREHARRANALARRRAGDRKAVNA